MEVLILLAVAGCILLLPIVALVVALVAASRARRTAASLEETRGALAQLRRELMALRDQMKRAKAEAPARAETVPEEETGRPWEAAVPPAEPAAPPLPPARPEPVAPAPALPQPQPGVQAPAAAPPSPPPRPPETPRIGLEERLGARLPVWIGSLALAMAGAFLVKYSFDKGLLSPPVRVMLGILFGVALLAAGELIRKRSAYVSQGFSAAGLADLYASFLAAVNLYHLIPPVAGFGLMILTTVVAVALSLPQGVLIAVIGLVGGFFTPYWIHTGEPNPAGLFTYLLLLQGGLLTVTRRRRWWPLAGLTLAAGMAWVVLWLALPFRPAHAPWLGLFLLASVAVFLASGFVGRASEAWGDRRIPTTLNWASTGSGLILTGVLVGVNHYGSLEWLFLGLLGAACLFLGSRDPRYEGLGWLASAAGAALLLAWSSNLKIADLDRFTWTALGYGGLMALGAYACLWGAGKAARWAALSAASAIVYLLLAYQGWTVAGGSLHWGLPTLCLAALFLGLALPVANRRGILPEGEQVLAALAVAVTTFVSLAVPMELERQWLAVAWALEVAALVWIAGRLAVPALRTLAWLVAGLVAVRLLMNPYVLTYPIGQTPVVNWLLYGYGIPILAFAVAAWICRRDGAPHLSEALHWEAVALSVAMIALEVRHYFHPEKLDAPKAYLAEWGTLTVAWMLLGLGLLLASRTWPHRSIDWGGRAVLVLAVLQCGMAQVLGANPLWWHHPVGQTPVFNALLWVYGGPALLCLIAAWELNRRGEIVMPRLLGVTALGLSFLLLTLEIRQAFQGAYLDGHGMSNAEKYAYSIAWVLFGTVLLVAGILKRGAVMRYASLAVMLLAVGKVFLYDLSQLKDLYRVFSLIPLGLSLLLLAFLYQRYVFSRGKP